MQFKLEGRFINLIMFSIGKKRPNSFYISITFVMIYIGSPGLCEINALFPKHN